jgi:hypothetical protein
VKVETALCANILANKVSGVESTGIGFRLSQPATTSGILPRTRPALTYVSSCTAGQPLRKRRQASQIAIFDDVKFYNRSAKRDRGGRRSFNGERPSCRGSER